MGSIVKYSANNKAARIFAKIGIVISTLSVVLTLIFTFSNPGISTDGTSYQRANFWWNYAQFFTTQTNLLVFAFFVCYWINTYKPIIKNNVLQDLSVSYITVTFLIYMSLLLKDDVIGSHGSAGASAFFWIQNSLVHIINPLCMIGFAICQYCSKVNKYPIVKFWKFFLIGAIYPTVYVIYVCIVPFVSIHSTYGTLTNLNKNLVLTLEDGRVVAGSLSNLAIIFGVWFLFAVIMSTYYWADRKIKLHK